MKYPLVRVDCQQAAAKGEPISHEYLIPGLAGSQAPFKVPGLNRVLVPQRRYGEYRAALMITRR